MLAVISRQIIIGRAKQVPGPDDLDMPDYSVGYWQHRNEELLALDARYRAWENTQMKGIIMPIKKIENFMGTGKTAELIPTKRTRRPKGTPPGITVETVKNAYVDLYIPERPEGMNKVVIRLFKSTEAVCIDWPEALGHLEAMRAYFFGTVTGALRYPQPDPDRSQDITG